LAITEVMSSGSTNESGLQRPDFWELTNFGTNEVNLEGYRWFDKDDVSAEGRKEFPAITLTPGEPIIVIRGGNSVVSDTAAFREWWGPALPVNLKIYFSPYPSPGFDPDDGDAVRLWDPEGSLVDEVRFGKARMGFTFTYNTNSGAFSQLSEQGVAGALRAAIGGDVGSPGYATNGPVAMRISQQPIGQSVEPGSEIILRVQAAGRPSPQYRWYRDGIPIQAAGAISAIPRLVCFADCGPSWRLAPGPNDLMLSGIEPGQSGDYSVQIFNGLEKLTSVVARITVETNPSPLQVGCPLEESCVPCAGTAAGAHLVASPGQTVIFTVRNRGFPLPDFQWSHSADGVNFTDLPGETNRDLVLSDIQDDGAGIYRVRLQNSNGSTNAFARLTVKLSPQLEITEVMAWACPALDRLDRDWWELTNTNAEPVNLCRYRWDDGTAMGVNSQLAIGGGPTITNGVIIQPGESVILLESQTAESFVQWWGASNLPPNLRFVTYAANGLGEERDEIYLWDPNETDGSKVIDSLSFAESDLGVTLWFDPFMEMQGCGSARAGAKSIGGNCGAFQADRGCDIGSPGWTRWTPPTLTSVRREGSGIALSWSAQPRSSNRVQFARRLATPSDATVWEDLHTLRFDWAACVATDSSIGVEPQRFYRVLRVAPAECPCPEE
jgi:hypothetical protein